MEINEKMIAKEIKILEEMVEEGAIIVYVDKGEMRELTQEIVDATFKKKMTGMLAGLGLGMIAGYAIYKSFAKRKGTQSEVIVEKKGEKLDKKEVIKPISRKLHMLL